MRFICLNKQIRRNNIRSLLLLCAFPGLILVGVYAFFYFTIGMSNLEEANTDFLYTIPFVLGGVLIWFLIAYFANSAMIRLSTGAHSLERKDNMRIYNLLENLCISKGMKIPKLFVIDTNALNDFYSCIDEKY